MRGFIFSIDAAFALSFVMVMAVAVVIYAPGVSYSKMEQYELHRYAETSLATLLAGGDVASAVDKVLKGQTNAAKNMIKGKLLDLYSQRYNKALSIQLYSANMTQLVEFRSSHPSDKYPTQNDRVMVVRSTFVYGDKYGIATLQVW